MWIYMIEGRKIKRIRELMDFRSQTIQTIVRKRKAGHDYVVSDLVDTLDDIEATLDKYIPEGHKREVENVCV